MNSREAKEILLLYRSGIDGDEDADVTEALALAERDPELGNWFQEHCAFQDALRAKFKGIPIPDGLKEQILSERKAHFTPPSKRKLAFAVCSVFICMFAAIAFSLLRTHGERTFANFQIRMLKTVTRDYPPMDLETIELRRIHGFLLTHHAPANYLIPNGLQKTTPFGCAIMEWQGKPVSMLCFTSGKTTNVGPDLFLFVVNQSDMHNAPLFTDPQFVPNPAGGNITTATWTNNGKLYLLAGVGGEAFLREHIP